MELKSITEKEFLDLLIDSPQGHNVKTGDTLLDELIAGYNRKTDEVNIKKIIRTTLDVIFTLDSIVNIKFIMFIESTRQPKNIIKTCFRKYKSEFQKLSIQHQHDWLCFLAKNIPNLLKKYSDVLITEEIKESRSEAYLDILLYIDFKKGVREIMKKDVFDDFMLIEIDAHFSRNNYKNKKVIDYIKLKSKASVELLDILFKK